MRLLLAALMLLAAQAALAERIEIDAGDDPESRLEIRNVVLPGGEEAELYVVRGSPVTVTIGERQLIAEHIEVDLGNRVIRILGRGTFITPEQTVDGRDLVIELEQESLTGRDVLIVTEAIDVRGDAATRLPGQIDVVVGSFSPCSRCDQKVEDYGFRAGRLYIYPGDRIVAYDATVLVRGFAVATLPLLVFPLARPERQPRISVSQGGVGERAEVALDWPYVSGPNAFGTFSVRYYADVDPTLASWPHPLGGQVNTSYLGGGVDHVFYTERGEGNARFFYRPSFLGPTGTGRERDQYTVRFAYRTFDWQDEQGVAGQPPAQPSVDLEAVRDDARRDRLLEYRVELRQLSRGLRGVFVSQGFADGDPEDEVTSPSYDNRATPRRTPARLLITPQEPQFTVGPLLLRRLELDMGAFEDSSNPTNRSAAAQEFVQAGRLLERHALELTPLPLWSGLSIRGHTNFAGHYYTTGERQIDWDSQVSAEQRFGSLGSLGLVFSRDVNEGETPFRFDQIPLRTRTDLRGNLDLEPFSWLSLESSGGYVFRDSRRPELEGFMPIESRLRLFDDLSWLEASVSNRFDIEEGDPGNLEFLARLSSPEPILRAQLEIDHLQDLAVRPDRLTGEDSDETRTRVAIEYGLRYLKVDASGGYRYRPQAQPDEAPEYWLPFEAGLTAGTLEQQDFVPGLRLGYTRNIDLHRVEALSLEASARLGELQLAASQRFDLPEGGVAASSFSVVYPGVARLEATGFTLLEPAWLGLPEGEPRQSRFAVTLRHEPLQGREIWQLRYLSRFDPNLGPDGGLRDSALEGRLRLEDEQIGDSRFSVDLFLDLQLRDALLETSYLRRASLQMAVDLGGRVGVQGSLGYRATMDGASGRLSRAELRLDQVAFTVRAAEGLYLGALFDDVWEFTGSSPTQPPFDLRPELFVVWDRCCWALMAGWNSESGQVRVSLTAPGGEEGVTQVVDTPLVLPGREGVP